MFWRCTNRWTTSTATSKLSSNKKTARSGPLWEERCTGSMPVYFVCVTGTGLVDEATQPCLVVTHFCLSGTPTISELFHLNRQLLARGTTFEGGHRAEDAIAEDQTGPEVFPVLQQLGDILVPVEFRPVKSVG